MAKVLFFFTSDYPFGTGETFIENEIPYLAEAFDKIIVVSNNLNSPQTRTIPQNVHLERMAYELSTLRKIVSIRNVFSKLFWEEDRIIKKVYKISLLLPIFNTILQTLEKGRVFSWKIETIIKKYCKKDETVYLYSYWNNDMAFVLATYKLKNPEVKAFSRMHGWDIYFEANAIGYLPFRMFIFNNLDKVFSISEKGKFYYEIFFKSANLKISVSKLGVNKFATNKYSNDGTLRLLSISNLIPIKNLVTLINALSLLKIDFQWNHIGDGYLRAELEALSGTLIPGRFEFKGVLQNNEVMGHLKNNPIDLFINVSLSEGIPVSIMEAMSAGIPVIATAVGGTPEIVNNENGELLQPNITPREIANALEKFYRLVPTQKEVMRRTAFKTWHEKYNAEKNYKNFLAEILAL